MEGLPRELSLHILSFLDIKDILNFSEINRYWYELTNTDFIWKKFCKGGPQLNDLYSTDSQEGNVKAMCYWKWLYINYFRITDNWTKKKYVKTKVKCDGEIGNFKLASYDGITLVVCFTASITVFKVNHSNINSLQTLFVSKDMLLLLNSVHTNTLYIVLNCGKITAVYKLMDGKYESLGVFYKKQKASNLTFTNIKEDLFQREITSSFFSVQICSINSALHHHNLYIYVDKKIYIWNLQDLCCRMEIDALSFIIAQDKKCINICPDYKNITSYNNESQLFRTLNSNFKVSQLETNHNILVAIEMDDYTWAENLNRKICVWNKYTGDKLYETCMSLPDFCSLHSYFNIILGNITCGDNICAVQPKTNTLLWMKMTRRQDSIIHSFMGRLLVMGSRTLAGGKFIIASIDSVKCYHLIDAENGETLYTFEKEIKYVGFDLLIHMDTFSQNIIIRKYS